jgi:hypothetical protein
LSESGAPQLDAILPQAQPVQEAPPALETVAESAPEASFDELQRDALQPTEMGAHMLRAIYARHQQDWKWRPEHMDRLAGDSALRRAVEREGGVEALLPTLRAQSERWAREVAKYRLYPAS